MKRTPLPSHDWGDPLPNGDRECQTDGCSTVWVSVYDKPPPWPCKRSSSLDRSTPLSPVSDSNSEGVVTGTELAEWVRGLECLVAAGEPDHRCRGDVIAHHVLSRGSGHGDWRVTGDGRVIGNLVPLCDRAHREVHSDGVRTFEDRYDIGTLESWAKHYGREFPGEPPQQVRDRAQLREAGL